MRASRDWRSARYLAAQRRSKARREAQQRASKAQGKRATGEDVRAMRENLMDALVRHVMNEQEWEVIRRDEPGLGHGFQDANLEERGRTLTLLAALLPQVERRARAARAWALKAMRDGHSAEDAACKAVSATRDRASLS